MVKKKSTKSSTIKKATKNSLIENINKRKEKGTIRSKNKSKVSKKAYAQMEKGWPNS
jgi:hypothetical protein